MTTVLQQLTENLTARFPNELPPRHTELSELCHLQGNQEVVEYVLSYLQANDKEVTRESLLRNS